MRTVIRGATITLLLFNGLSGLFGGWSLMADPSGAALQFPADTLRYSPFPDFFLPGIVLFVLIGLFSLLVVVLTILKTHRHSYFIFFQGIILLGWLFFQIVFTHQGHLLQLLYGHIGLFLVGAGIFFSIGEEYELRLKGVGESQLA
jgi:hypothetical protein